MMKNKWFWPGLLLLGSILLLLLPVVFSEPAASDSAIYAWCDFLGSFHPLVLHLPIGFLLLVLALEVWSLFRKTARPPMDVALILNAVVAVVAAVLGFIWYQTGQWSGEEMEDHLWQGLTFSACAIWLPWIYRVGKDRSQLPYQLALSFTVGVMISAAHHGGESVHGDVMAKAPWNLSDRGGGSQRVVSHNPVVYTEIIKPILADKCYKCHAAKKQKGALRVDTIENMLEGGDTDTALVKGDASKSPLVTTIRLPLDDDLHMPPEGKTQVTENELALLEWWINEGAPEEKRLDEMEQPEHIVNILDKAVEQAALSSPNKKDLSSRSELADALTEFNAKYPRSLVWLSQNDDRLQFSAASMRQGFQDEDLEALEPFAPVLVEIDLNGTKVTDKVADLILASPHLQTVRLGETAVSNQLIERIREHSSLRMLVIHSTSVTDDAVVHLEKMKQLKKLFIWRTKISPGAAARIVKSLSSCQVEYGEEVKR